MVRGIKSVRNTSHGVCVHRAVAIGVATSLVPLCAVHHPQHHYSERENEQMLVVHLYSPIFFYADILKMNKAILIHEEKGNVEEVYIDISPQKNEIFLLLGGRQTFIGQWPDIDVVILKSEDGITENKNELPAPFHNEEVFGKILLIRMDENSEPRDFTLDEYELFHGRHKRLPV
jgi:hypothetical protein